MDAGPSTDAAAAWLPPRRPRRRRGVQWRRAWTATRRLLDEPDRTENAFEVTYALDPDWNAQNLERMLSCATGRRLFLERPSLLAALEDRERLEGLPDGSLGRAYHDHLVRWGLDPAKLVQLGRETNPVYRGGDEGLAWFVDRSGLMHDLWHVITGYGADGPGETVLLAFSHGQGGARSSLFLCAGATARQLGELGSPLLRALWRAWWRGRRAVQLQAVPWEELLDQPLERVRALTRVGSPEHVHPDGFASTGPPTAPPLTRRA